MTKFDIVTLPWNIKQCTKTMKMIEYQFEPSIMSTPIKGQDVLNFVFIYEQSIASC